MIRRIALAAALTLAVPLGGCATTGTGTISAKVEGSAETAYQAFVLAEEKLVEIGKLDREAFHRHETAAYNALLAFRAGQLTYEAFSAQLNTLATGG